MVRRLPLPRASPLFPARTLAQRARAAAAIRARPAAEIRRRSARRFDTSIGKPSKCPTKSLIAKGLKYGIAPTETRGNHLDGPSRLLRS
jgi:hypothetical protein